MNETLHDFAARYTAAWCSNNASSVAAFFAHDGSLQVNDAPAAIGRDAITQVANGFMTAFPDLQVFMDEVSDEGRQIIYRWTLSGTFGATGKPVRVSGCEVWRLNEDGLIAISAGRFDQAEYQRQIEFGSL